MSKPQNRLFPTIECERIILRELNEKDENEIFVLHTHIDVLRYINRAKAKNIDDANKFINKISNGVDINKWIYWAISHQNNSALIGTICLWNFSDDYSKAELGYELIPQYQANGYMNEALSKVIEYAFTTLKLNKIEAYTHIENKASIKLLEKHHFVKDKTIIEKHATTRQINKLAIYSRIA